MPLSKKVKGKKCTVTFTLPEGVEATSAFLVAEFNDWDRDAMPMQRGENGIWHLVVEFEVGKEFQYRYLVNGSEWLNDDQADGYTAHPYGGENSVLKT